MALNQTVRWACVVFSLIVVAPLVVQAQSLEKLATNLTTFADGAATWTAFLRAREGLLTWMTIAVITLGGVATVTALATHKAGKWVTAAIAAVIAVVSGIKSQVFHADEESFGALATATETFVTASREEVANYREALVYDGGLTSDDRGYYLAQFSKFQGNWNDIQTRASKVGISIMTPRQMARASFEWPGVARVFAAQTQQRAPQVPANTLAATGKGVCTSTSGAREYARYDGRRRIALQLEPGASPERLDAVIASVDDLAVDQWSRLSADKATRVATQTAQVLLNRAFSRPAVLNVSSEARPAPRYSAVASVPAGFSGRLEVGSPKVAKGQEGAFRFVLNVTRRAGGISAELVEIVTHSDSSAGSTRWMFDVMAGADRLFAVPLRRLDDSGQPTTCKVQPDERLQGTARVAATGPIELRVLGFKPKDS